MKTLTLNEIHAVSGGSYEMTADAAVLTALSLQSTVGTTVLLATFSPPAAVLSLAAGSSVTALSAGLTGALFCWESNPDLQAAVTNGINNCPMLFIK